jgi:NAD(P)-dependent dehydrogenase (short-subunit alcohol dehydrogenase family)
MTRDYDRQQDERPGQHQPRQPGIQAEMKPQPVTVPEHYRGSGKLEGKVALVVGGDSGIGRSVSALFAMEGADVAVVYLDEDTDALETRRLVEEQGRSCTTIACDVRETENCQKSVAQAVDELGRLDVLVNHAGEQHQREKFEDITPHQLERTFRTNVFSMFYLARAALEHLPEGGTIVNTTSVTAYEGNPTLIDYSATNGAIVSFTRALAQSLVKRGVRVNAVAPGPVWTPLIPATFPSAKVEDFGTQTPMGRIGQPAELGPAYVHLASDDSSFTTGQVIHVNGGQWSGS